MSSHTIPILPYKGVGAVALILAALLAMAPSIGQADDIPGFESVCVPKKTMMFFTNGVLNSFAEANLSRGHTAGLIRQAAPPMLKDGETLDSAVAYNYKSGVLDFFQVAGQILAQEGIELSVTDTLDILRSVRSAVGTASAKVLLTALYGAIAQQQASLAEQTSAEHLQLVNQSLSEGNRVVVVAHSQGNLFANGLFHSLPAEAKEHVGLVPVATPANNVGGDPNSELYVTAVEDVLISNVSDFLFALLPNFRACAVSPFFFVCDDEAFLKTSGFHAYVEFYLGVSPARNEVSNLIRKTFEAVPFLEESKNCITFFVKVDPKGTYLTSHPTDHTAPGPPSSFDLSEVGIQGGQVIFLQSKGSFFFGEDWPIPGTRALGVFVNSAGHFLEVDFESPATEVMQAPSVLPCHLDPETFADGVPEHFDIPDDRATSVVVPTGATSILFSSPDCFFDDNFDPEGDYGVDVTFEPAPEP